MEVGTIKHRLNVEGKYYTSDECDGCAYCASVAPENFDFDKDTNVLCFKRPATAGEEELVPKQKEDCHRCTHEIEIRSGGHSSGTSVA
jgi:ferredoxin